MNLPLRYVSCHIMTCVFYTQQLQCSCLAAMHVKWAGSICDATELRRETVFRNLFVTTVVINKSFVIWLGLQVKFSTVSQLPITASFHSPSSSSFIHRLNFRQYGVVYGITEIIILAPVPCILYYFLQWHSDDPALLIPLILMLKSVALFYTFC